MRFNLNGRNFTLHFLSVVGSKLHRLDTKDSDTDLKGVVSWDNDVKNSLSPYEETLDNKNMSKEDRLELTRLLNESFNFGLSPEDDVDLFESRFFFLTALKNDSNVLDMLSSDMVLYETEEFKKVREQRVLFNNFEYARKRFTGMSFNTFKLGSKEGGKSKDLAKSLQALYSFRDFVKTGAYSHLLQPLDRLLVKSVKEGNKTTQEVNALREELESECMLLELPEYVDNTSKLNELLLTLNQN